VVTTREQADHFAAAEQARRSPLTWVLVCKPKDRAAAVTQVQRIKTGVHKAYRKGSYDAKHDRNILGHPQVWAKWIGGKR
jgi:hypothetical protein